MTPNAERDFRLDLVRGVAIALVLLWHTQPFNGLWIPHLYQASGWALFLLNMQLSLIAVPTLLLLSLTLFVARCGTSGAYLRRRLKRIGLLLVTYSVVQVVFFIAIRGQLPSLNVSYLWMGGPPLPLVGDSVFYFLFDLFCLTALAWLYMRLPARAQNPLGITIVVTSFALFCLASTGALDIPYWSLANFALYVPLAAFLHKSRPSLRPAHLGPLLGLWLGTVALDLVLNSPFPFSLEMAPTPIYGRVSIALGAFTVLLAAQTLEFRRSWPLELAGRYSLGLYAYHKYFLYLFTAWLAPLSLSVRGEHLNPTFAALFAVAATVGLVGVLARTRLRALVA